MEVYVKPEETVQSDHNHKQVQTGEKSSSRDPCRPLSQRSEGASSKNIHSGKNPVKCDECGKEYKTRYLLNHHQKQHTGEFTCDQCGVVLSSKGNLTVHKRIHTGEKPFSCKECDKTFISESKLKVHQRIHTGETLNCDHCSKAFCTAALLKRHLRVHTKEKPFSCDQCEKRFRYSPELLKHKFIHHSQEGYKCSDCEKVFFTQYCLKKHQKTFCLSAKLPENANSPKQKNLTCNQCGVTLSRLDKLLDHKRLHMDERPFCCDLCGHSFATSYRLQRHQRIHSGERPDKCDQCGCTFTNRASLRAHMRTHTGEKPYKCDQCGESFSYRSNLYKHSEIHTGKKASAYKCDKCHKDFASIGTLNLHKLRHSKDLIFPCMVCKKTFWTKDTFISHQKIHFPSNNALYSCDQCEKKFKTLGYLEHHKRRHTIVFCCDSCGKSFSDEFSCKKHEKICTKEDGCVKEEQEETNVTSDPKIDHGTAETPPDCFYNNQIRLKKVVIRLYRVRVTEYYDTKIKQHC